MRHPILPTGHKHGRLTVLAFERDPHDPKHPKYRCRCDCGKETLTTISPRSHTASCGCLRIEKLNQRSLTHGMSYTPEFRAWCDMRERCRSERRHDYARYGGRGITVCDRWLESFDNFIADMGPKPTAAHSLDRKDNAGNYTPDNCRWATAKTQRINQHRTELVTWNGRTQTLKDWSRELGVSYSCLHQRRRSGWSVHRCLTQPWTYASRSK